MTSVRSALIGLAAGVVAYAGMAGFMRPGDQVTATIAELVTPSVSPVLSPTKMVTRGDKSGDKKGDTSLSPLLSPVLSVTPRVTSSVTPRASAAPSPTATPQPSRTPTPLVTPRVNTPTPSPTPSPSPSATPTPTPLPTPQETPTPTPTPAPTSVHVVINEVAWSGTAVPNVGGSDEWFELYNAGESAVDVTGWSLHGDADSNGNTRVILLAGTMQAGGYFLIERTDDTTISDISADVFGPFGGSGLRNDPGEFLELRDASGVVVDEVNCSVGWFAGTATPDYASMERINPLGEGSDPSNWASNDGLTTTGEDAGSSPIRGTPRFKNSVTP